MPRTSPPFGAAGRLPGAADDATLDPAWRPWLALLDIALDATSDPAGAEVSLSPAERLPDAPLLDGATVRLDARRAGALLRRLADAAGVLGAGELHPSTMIRAAIMRDEHAIAREAERIDVPADTVAVLALMAATPVLHAAARGLGKPAAQAWQRGYCPVCGAWPSLVEMRGIERERRVRCGCCGADWPLPVLRCAFCAEMDHHQLGSLVPEDEEQYRRVETCERCCGYLKVVTTLGALPFRVLARQDLATVPLDLVAQDRGYARPARPGWAITIEVVA
jgi:FdhE protein